ncbi:MAG TPA: SPOR domain-containing protein [Gammaproteobacteria bacterium]
MNMGLKQRLVGAVVLIALAVIFLPMLLPGNNDSTMPLLGSNVPKPPNTHFEPIEIPLQLPPAAPAAEVAVVDTPQAGDVASNEKPQQPAPVATPAPAAAPQPAPAPVAASKPPAPGEAWALQLGSFSSSVNALALQEKARKAGFTAYVEKVKGEQGISYRVRVGPESSRERADALRERVQGKLGMVGMVVPHKS